jgi:hypothetical protein
VTFKKKESSLQIDEKISDNKNLSEINIEIPDECEIPE